MKDLGISSDKHALIIPPFMGRGKRVHPMSFPDASMPSKLLNLITCDIYEDCFES